ncbi:hypothetical protein Val02_51720 [Virgisporangium aliadipatigenens]|uniref:Uncharacterized protein n=1 Tax=Virgisporangium aliadipatigenens TaxID=741659 RepID=A0A8J3YN45_9ACTN|nr:hypothetical protein [Virgisporangium aliadipatigenens]GIJ48286.1 hypothetical protein Val02_51720 [Virgisporangium aliadipatigenens]
MRYSRRHTLASAGLGFTAVASIAPWTHFPGAYTVFSLPHWKLWAVAVLALHAVSFLAQERDATVIQAGGGVLGVAGLTAVVLIVRGYTATAASYGLIAPEREIGLWFAVAGIVCAVGAVFLREPVASARAR